MIDYKPNKSDLARLEAAKEFSIKQNSAIAHAGGSSGGVIYINPNATAEEVRKALIILATQIN